jgi:hypothetical protein
MALIEPYAAKYYEVLPRVVEKRDREFTEKFMTMMSPAFLARPEDESAFTSMRESNAAKNHDFFDIFLKKSIETINMTKASRHLCETYKTD